MSKALRIIFIVFLAIGLVFLAVTGILGIVTQRDSADMIEVTGTIVQLRGSKPTVEYSLNGQSYSCYPSVKSTTFRLGAPYKLMVDPSDPWRYTDITVIPIFGLIGGVFTVVAVIIGVILRRQAARREELLAIGRRVSAVITDVRIQHSVTVNGRHPVYAVAECTHPYTGQTTEVKSPSVFRRDLTSGQALDVYFDPNDPDKYLVDLTEEAK